MAIISHRQLCETIIIIRFIKKLLRTTRARHTPTTADHAVPRHQHRVSKTDISTQALKVLNRLSSSDFQAYLVGGSVRDLLLGKAPKDFDVATNATPAQIKRLFRNARIIGRRFKLVHVAFYREIIEVATFRGSEGVDIHQLRNDEGMLIRDNAYGTLEEDAFRRDLTINSLYYNVEDASIVDLTGGVQDVQDKIVRLIGVPTTRYQEDPVRMLRVIRFAAKLHFTIAPETAAPLSHLANLLQQVSNSRLFEEITKLYHSGEAASVQALLVQHGLFSVLFPATHALLDSDYPTKTFIENALKNTDSRIQQEKPVTPSFLVAVLLWFPLIERTKELEAEGLMPLVALESAMTDVITKQNKIVNVPRRFAQIMREIWVLQYRFPHRSGARATHLLEHPRFRAAYDFLVLRAAVGHESPELATWWTTFQEVDEDTKTSMLEALPKIPKKRARKRKRRKPSNPSITPPVSTE